MFKNTDDMCDAVSNIFCPYFKDLPSKILRDLQKQCLDSVNFRARKMLFFSNGSEFRQKLIGTIIRVAVRHIHT